MGYKTVHTQAGSEAVLVLVGMVCLLAVLGQREEDKSQWVASLWMVQVEEYDQENQRVGREEDGKKMLSWSWVERELAVEEGERCLVTDLEDV